MTYEDALEIVEDYSHWEDSSCCCHCGNPPCSKCENQPCEELYKEALDILKKNED